MQTLFVLDCVRASQLSAYKPILRVYSVTSKPLPYNGFRGEIAVQSARVFTENTSNLLHLASRPLHMGAKMSHILSIVSWNSKVIRVALG